MSGTQYRIFAAITPGLETLLEAELRAMGLLQAQRVVVGGVELGGDRLCLWRLARCSRLAESLRVRAGRAFEARTFDELMDGAARLPWAAYLVRGGPAPRVSVTCHKSRLYHSAAVAERVGLVIQQRLGCRAGGGGDDAAARVFVRLVRDRVKISIDASGELLHRRGYRTHVGPAPMRETLAAALLRAAEYDPTRPLWDPFCGAGTIVCEAALSTGAGEVSGRRFAFEDWPTHDAAAYALFAEQLPAPGPPGAALMGSDVDAPVLRAARDNAARAGLAGQVTFAQGDFEKIVARVPTHAQVISNPPYGRRLDGTELKRTFRRLGRVLERRPDLDPVVVLTGDRDFARSTGLRWRVVAKLRNRGLPVQVLSLKL